MSVEMFERVIKETQTELDGRETRRLMAWAVIALFLFLVPVILLFNLSSDTVYGSSYAPIVIVWLLIALGISNVIATALIAPRTVELRLALATASSLLLLLKSNNTQLPVSTADESSSIDE